MTSPSPIADRISVAELQALMPDPNLRILDVRTGGEFETVHIPGSYNIPLDTLGEHIADVADVEHPVVLVCQSGGRASRAHDKLSAAGKRTGNILEGGMTAWVTAGGDVVRTADHRWAMDRQVRLVAGALVLIAVAASAIVPPLKWLAAAIGAGLTFSAVTDTCAMGTVLSKLPYNRTDRCDIEGVLAELSADPIQV